jgi:hypothetical protein
MNYRDVSEKLVAEGIYTIDQYHKGNKQTKIKYNFYSF